jgi:hypothetical protein
MQHALDWLSSQLDASILSNLQPMTITYQHVHPGWINVLLYFLACMGMERPVERFIPGVNYCKRHLLESHNPYNPHRCGWGEMLWISHNAHYYYVKNKLVKISVYQ